MTYRDTQDALHALYAVASAQGGYFTAKQAQEVGYGYTHLDYHTAVGNFERVERGLYRLPTIPPAEHDDLIRLSLWSRDRRDRPQAVVSHETALDLHGLGELMPSRVHLTVPRSFRKRPPVGCALHKADLAPADAEEWTGFSVTTPLRTLIDLAAGGAVTQEQIEKAVADALDRGLVRRSKIITAAVDRPRAKRLLLAPVLDKTSSKRATP